MTTGEREVTRGAAFDASSRWDWEEVRGRCLRLAARLLRSRDDAEEAVQEALVRGWRHAGSCRDPENPAPWLLSITRRECARVARRRAERAEAGLEQCAERGSPDPSRGVDSAIDLRVVVGGLSDEERELVRLRYGEDLSQPQVARVLGVPEGTVKTKLHRLRARLRSTLGVRS